ADVCMAVAVAHAVVIVAPRVTLIVFVMLRRIPQRGEIAWKVRGEGFAADVLQVVRGFVPVRAFSGVFFVMTVMAVGSIDERPRDLPNAVSVNEEEREQRERRGGGQRAGRGG